MLKLARLEGKPEIFYSIQGEGKSMGRPSVFMRLSLCNLYCVWCDTDHTWNWQGTRFTHLKDKFPNYQKYDKGEVMMMCSNELLLNILQGHDCKNIIITGGEPLVQQKDLVPLLLRMKELDDAYYFEVETNGTLRPLPELDRCIDQYNVSIKLANAGVKESERLKPEAIRFFAASEKANFKFVIDGRSDLEEVTSLLKNYSISPEKVYLMPQGMDASSLLEKQRWLIEICKQYHFNYTDRLHIHIYGDKRGV